MEDEYTFPYSKLGHFGMNWVAIVEEIEWRTSHLPTAEKKSTKCFEVGIGSYGLTSVHNSKVYLFEQKKVYNKGDYVHVVIETYDKYRNARLKGGDFLQGVMIDSDHETTRTAGRVVDYDNGTYSVYFYAGWKGNTKITMTLSYTREAILFLNMLRRRSSERLGWIGTFSDGKTVEQTNCSIINNGIWQNKCEFSNKWSLGSTVMVCDKVPNMSCDTLKTTSHDIEAMEMHTNADIQSKSYLFESEYHDVNIGKNPLLVNVRDSDVRLNLPICAADLPVPLSCGFWKDNLTFIAMTCKSQQWEKPDIEKCLSGKQLYLNGDSTLKQMKFELYSLLSPSNTLNSTLHYKFVALRAGSPIQNVSQMIFEGDFIDRISTKVCQSEIAVVVLNFAFHFSSWTVRAYLDRIMSAKFAVERLFHRCPNSVVVIKLSHPRDNVSVVQSVHSANYLYYDMDRMVRRVFNGIGVRFLDLWDMSASHSAANNIHMPDYLIKQQWYQMLSYICPDMVI
ncbi:NXPE family member 2-like [Glandiceps talaboti]